MIVVAGVVVVVVVVQVGVGVVYQLHPHALSRCAVERALFRTCVCASGTAAVESAVAAGAAPFRSGSVSEVVSEHVEFRSADTASDPIF